MLQKLDVKGSNVKSLQGMLLYDKLKTLDGMEYLSDFGNVMTHNFMVYKRDVEEGTIKSDHYGMYNKENNIHKRRLRIALFMFCEMYGAIDFPPELSKSIFAASPTMELFYKIMSEEVVFWYFISCKELFETIIRFFSTAHPDCRAELEKRVWHLCQNKERTNSMPSFLEICALPVGLCEEYDVTSETLTAILNTVSAPMRII